MTRYFAAIVLFFLMALMPLAGCVSQNSDISEENDTTVISDNSIVVEPSPVDDVTTNGSATGGGASNVTYAGFLDNSSINGFRINPIENYSAIHRTQNENNCTMGHNDWIGNWSEPWCVRDYGAMIAEADGNTTLENGELCFTVDTESDCMNMTVSNRVAWVERIDPMQNDPDLSLCFVYVQSEAFTPSYAYNLSVHAYDENGSYMRIEWDALWNDSAYVAWENERISAYNSESGNIPSWCTNPRFDDYYWASQVVGE